MKPSAPTLVLGCTVCILLGTVEAVWQLTCGTVLDRLAERAACKAIPSHPRTAARHSFFGESCA